MGHDTAVGHLNNARQVLSLVHERILAMGHGAYGSVDLFEVDRDVVAAGRRIAAAVEQLTPSPLRPCKNCQVAMHAVLARDGYGRRLVFNCSFCGQVETIGGEVLASGESYRVELTELGVGALEVSAIDQAIESEVDVDAAIENMRDRYHRGLEAPDSIEGSEP